MFQIENLQEEDMPEIEEHLEQANIRLRLSRDSAPRIISGLVHQTTCLKDLAPSLGAFWQGAERLGLCTLIRTNKGELFYERLSIV